MNYLTRKDVRLAAKQGRRAAIQCSIRHWKELVSLKPSQINSGSPIWPGGGECALCVRYAIAFSGFGRRTTKTHCGSCPLGHIDSCYNEKSAYKRADEEWHMIVRSYLYLNTPEYNAVRRFRYHGKKLIKILESLL